ncbi:MAG: YezD family protein [Gemmataceae bacterium]|nr:YezD family protein [Gemmataceae bacterium]
MTEEEPPAADRHLARALQVIENALRGLQFGEVTVIVQDGLVIQVERTERTRLRRPSQNR